MYFTDGPIVHSFHLCILYPPPASVTFPSSRWGVMAIVWQRCEFRLHGPIG